MTDTHVQTQEANGTGLGARPIGLHVSGADLLLEGRFNHWMPVAVMSDRPDVGVVQILFDSTSPANEGARPPGQDLFSFRAEEAKPVGERVFSAKGRLEVEGQGAAEDEDAEVEAIIQAPEGHSPFFFVTLSIDRTRFEPLWSAIEDRAVLSLGEQKEMRPSAWLRVPGLAAA